MKLSTQNNHSSVQSLITSRKQDFHSDFIMTSSFSLWMTLNQDIQTNCWREKQPPVTGHMLWVTAVLQALSVAMLINVTGRWNYIKMTLLFVYSGIKSHNHVRDPFYICFPLYWYTVRLIIEQVISIGLHIFKTLVRCHRDTHISINTNSHWVCGRTLVSK